MRAWNKTRALVRPKHHQILKVSQKSVFHSSPSFARMRWYALQRSIFKRNLAWQRSSNEFYPYFATKKNPAPNRQEEGQIAGFAHNDCQKSQGFGEQYSEWWWLIACHKVHWSFWDSQEPQQGYLPILPRLSWWSCHLRWIHEDVQRERITWTLERGWEVGMLRKS